MSFKKLIITLLGFSCLCVEAQMTALYQVSQNDVPIATEIWIHKPENTRKGGLSYEITKTRPADKERGILPEQTRELGNTWETVIFKSGDRALLRQHFMRHPTELEPNEKSIGHISVEELVTRKVLDRWPFIVSVTLNERKFWDLTPAMLKARFEIFMPEMKKVVATEIYDEDEYHFPYSRVLEVYNMMNNTLISKTSYIRLTN